MRGKFICLLAGHRWGACEWYGDECSRCKRFWDFDDESPFVGLIPFFRRLVPSFRPFVYCDQCKKRMLLRGRFSDILLRGRFSDILFCSKECSDEWIPF